jgi:hypothetical protein
VEGARSLDADGEDSLDIGGATGTRDEAEIPQLQRSRSRQPAEDRGGVIERCAEVAPIDDDRVSSAEHADHAVLDRIRAEEQRSCLGNRQERDRNSEIGVDNFRRRSADQRAIGCEPPGRVRSHDSRGTGCQALHGGRYSLLIGHDLDRCTRFLGPLAETIEQRRSLDGGHG